MLANPSLSFPVALSKRLGVLVVALTLSGSQAVAAGSQCFGTVSHGHLESGVQLPSDGANFVAYSDLGVALGRTYVHSRVAEVVTAAYAELARTLPTTRYVYGETGWEAGGRIRPHRTHQNGLSVDFFVPIQNAAGESIRLPISAANRFGYGIEFGPEATYGEYSIDIPAIAEHLYQLDRTARQRGVGIALVIFDPAFVLRLFATSRGADLRRLNFMKGRPWVRHDEHYHVDFSVPCKPEPD